MFQVVYESVRDIAVGEELLLGLREPLQLQDMLGENTTEDRSDRETGKSLKAYRKSSLVFGHIRAWIYKHVRGKGTLVCFLSPCSSSRSFSLFWDHVRAVPQVDIRIEYVRSYNAYAFCAVARVHTISNRGEQGAGDSRQSLLLFQRIYRERYIFI